MTDATRTTLNYLGESDASTFMGVPALAHVADLAGDIAVFGAPCCSPYLIADEYANANLGGPTAIRQALATWAWAHDRFDWDQEDCVYEDMAERVVDLGDLPVALDDPVSNRQLIRDTCATIVANGAVPLALGGDDSIPFPVLWALEELGEDVTVVHVDSHIDWRHEVHGELYGLSSGMRRASELPFVKNMIQLGMRGLSSAGRQDVEDARARGVHIVPARAVHARGIEPILDRIEPGANVFLTIDLDGLDPSIMPAVYVPAPGGLLYWQLVELIEGIVAKARLRAFVMVELVPARDPEGLGALTAGRIASNAIAALLGATGPNR